MSVLSHYLRTRAKHRRSGGWSAANSSWPSCVIADTATDVISLYAVSTDTCLRGVSYAGLSGVRFRISSTCDPRCDSWSKKFRVPGLPDGKIKDKGKCIYIAHFL